MKIVWTVVFAGASLLGSGCMRAQTPADVAAVKALVAGEAEAWNKGDAQAFGEHYAEDGSFTNIVGQRLFGREAFVKQHAMIFATIYKGSHASFTLARTKFVRPDVAIVDVDAGVAGFQRLPPGMAAGSDGILHTQLQMTLTREKGSWWIASFHNVAIVPLPSQP